MNITHEDHSWRYPHSFDGSPAPPMAAGQKVSGGGALPRPGLGKEGGGKVSGKAQKESVAMQYSEVLALLRDLRAYLLPKGWLRSPRHRRAHLLGRIEAAIAQLNGGAHPAIAIARTRLEGAPVLRIDADEAQIEETSDGVWVRGWVWVEQQALACCDPGRMTKLRNALADLPQQTCAVFLAHCVEGLPFPAIALRLNLDVAEVQRELASALLILSEDLDET